MTERVVRWFYGAPNLVGIVLALCGLVLFIGGVIHGWLVPPIVVGLYLVGAVATPRPRGIGDFAVGGDLDPDRVKKALAEIVDTAQKRLPDELASKVVAIQATILDLLPKLKASSIDRQDLFAVERTVSAYLPQTLDNYLTLPRSYADSRTVSGGKTARQLLAEQLDLIGQKMQEVSEAVAKDDVAKLLAQGRFLEERFGRNKELELPAPVRAVPPSTGQ